MEKHLMSIKDPYAYIFRDKTKNARINLPAKQDQFI